MHYFDIVEVIVILLSITICEISSYKKWDKYKTKL